MRITIFLSIVKYIMVFFSFFDKEIERRLKEVCDTFR